MKSLVFGALRDAAGCLDLPGSCVLDSLELDVLVQFDVPAESVGFVECTVDALGFSQELAAEYLLSAESLSAQEVLGAVAVQRDVYGYY